jgi:RNA polymerase sigma-54 factor
VQGRLGQIIRTDTTLRVDPKIVLAGRVLQLGQMELQQLIESELCENPALERLESDAEPVTEEDILKAVAPQELRFRSEDAELRRSLPPDDDRPDWHDLAADTPDLRQHLAAQLLPTLPRPLRPLGAYVVECLTDSGYLHEPPEELALATGCSLEEVETVVRALQQCEPSGVGAANVRECLLLQLRGATSVERKLARLIIKEHMDDFLARRTMRIARRHRVMPDVVENAFAEILQLSPYPGEAFSPRRHSSPRVAGVQPDLVLSRTESGWTIETRGPQSRSLTVSRSYLDRKTELERMTRPPKDERRHVSLYIRRAENFIDVVELRSKTLIRIGEYLVEHQAGFISTGRYEFLQPLTRTQLASDIGLHDSTISRATADKFVQIDTGEIVSFDVFFKPALRVQKMIEEILATENPGNPLSDERIAEILATKGVQVARRTVNKYRDRTKLLSSRKRKTA